MKKIKVMHIISHLENSGPVNIVFGILKNIDYSKFEIFILTLSDEKENSRIEEFKALPIKIYQTNISNKNIILGKLKQVKKIIKEEKIEIVHSHCIASTIVVSKISNVYKISTIHCDFKTDLYFRFKFKGIIYSYLYKFF